MAENKWINPLMGSRNLDFNNHPLLTMGFTLPIAHVVNIDQNLFMVYENFKRSQSDFFIEGLL